MVSMTLRAATQSPFSCIMIEVTCFLLGLGLHDGGVAPHLHLAAVSLARELAVGGDVRGVGGYVVGADIGEDEVAVPAGEVPTALRRAGIHDHRMRRLDRLRLQIAALDA